jgi:hypothetical protein
MKPKPPIIIDESGDVSFFESVEAAEQYLEAIDVLTHIPQ